MRSMETTIDSAEAQSQAVLSSPGVDVNAKDDRSWPVKKRVAFATAGVTFLLGMFDLIDRQVMASILPYLKTEFALNDKQLGLVMSALNLAMSILVVPTACLVDKWSRTKMICIMGIVWSLATGACAFAGSYMQILIARFMCGCGEAGYQPAGQSLLAACFPSRLRVTAVAVIVSGMSFGAPIGLLAGAYIAEHYGWRHALGFVAIPGLFLSLLALFLKDFRVVAKKTSEETSKKSQAQKPYWQAIKELLKTPTICVVLLGAIFLRMFNGVSFSWLPSYFKRVGGVSLTTASTISAVVITALSLAIFCGGPLVDRMRKKNIKMAPVWITMAMFVGGMLNFIAYYLCVPGTILQIAFLIGSNLFLGTIFSAGTFLLIDIAKADIRATAVSMMILAQNLFGYTLGPLITGAISDKFGLATAMWVISTVLIIGGCLYSITIYTYPRDKAKVKQVELSFD